MTALPSLRWPLTSAEYAALPEDVEHRYELEEGMLVMSPSPLTRHRRRLLRLAIQVERQLPAHLDAVLDNDVDLDLVEPNRPGFVRRPRPGDRHLHDRRPVPDHARPRRAALNGA